jgi:hypothetical protein
MKLRIWSGVIGAALLFSACARTVPSSSVPVAGYRYCHVWVDGVKYRAGALVANGKAWGSGLRRASAHFGNATDIYVSTWGPLAGYYERGQLTMYGPYGVLGPVTIDRWKTRVSDLTVENNGQCSDREAALGVVTLLHGLTGIAER